jgi:hypothetical protein
MKRALLVYESMFGNTHRIAEAVAEGLATWIDVSVVEVSKAPREVPPDVDLVVVGGPTHAFSMSRPNTRRSAADQGADPDAAGHDGIREWVSTVTAPPGALAVAFDTKVSKPRLPGSAARSAERRLRRRGLAPLDHARTFYVTGTDGDLVDGELDRARQWGSQLGQHRLSAAG